ncbi:hypothetical protein HN51_061213 [Arachis hypogaea]
MGYITITTSLNYLYHSEGFWPSLIAIISSFIVIKTLNSPKRQQWFLNKRNQEADNLMFYVYNKCKNNNNSFVNVRVATQHYCGNYFGDGRNIIDGGPGLEEVEYVDAIFTLELMVAAVDNLSNAVEWALGEMT